MTIKEFSHKHSLVFFWSTVVLAILLLLTTCFGGRDRYMMMKGGYGYDRYDYNKRMMDSRPGTNIPSGQRQMMGPGQGQGQPLINNTSGAVGTVEAGTQVNQNVPVEVQ